MHFDPFQYMRYAKRLEYAEGIFLAGSGMSLPRKDKLPFKSDDFSLTSLCANYGDPRNIDLLADRYRTGGANVVMTAGTSEANFLAFSCVCERDEKVIIESPGYHQFYSLCSFVDCEPVVLPRRFEDGFIPDPDEFKKLLDDKVHLVALTNLHNPSMARVPRDTLKDIVDAAAKNGTTVLVDEVYLDHLAVGDGDESAYSLGDNVVVTASLTKVYGLGALRFGWAVAPEKIAGRMIDLIDVVDPELPQITQNLGWRALTELGRLRVNARRLHDQNWPIVKEWLDSREDLEYFFPPGGITVWIHIKGIEETGNLATVVRKEYGVLVAPGEYFQSPGWIRLGYKVAPSELREGLARLGHGIDEFRKHVGEPGS